MGKKRRSKKVYSCNRKNIIDMSERKQLTIGNVDTYDVQELLQIIEELNAQMEQVEKKYYSSNDLVERIIKRNFVDIVREKCSSVFKKDHTFFGKYNHNFGKL